MLQTSWGKEKIKIITVNIPESYLNAIQNLIGDNGLYPSRSELIRVAVREFLIKELEAAEAFKGLQQHNDLFAKSSNQADFSKENEFKKLINSYNPNT